MSGSIVSRYFFEAIWQGSGNIGAKAWTIGAYYDEGTGTTLGPIHGTAVGNAVLDLGVKLNTMATGGVLTGTLVDLPASLYIDDKSKYDLTGNMSVGILFQKYGIFQVDGTMSVGAISQDNGQFDINGKMLVGFNGPPSVNNYNYQGINLFGNNTVTGSLDDDLSTYNSIYSYGTMSIFGTVLTEQDNAKVELLKGVNISGTLENRGNASSISISADNLGAGYAAISGLVENRGSSGYIRMSGANLYASSLVENVGPGGTADLIYSDVSGTVISSTILGGISLTGGFISGSSVGVAITGYGTVAGNIYGNIQAYNGDLFVDGFFSGRASVDSNATLSIKASVSASAELYDFGGTLKISNFSGFSGAIILQGEDDDQSKGAGIDLTSVQANLDSYNSANGILYLFEDRIDSGDKASLVGTLTIQTRLNPFNTYFGLTPDGNGGTDVTVSEGPPDAYTLGELADATYHGIETVISDAEQTFKRVGNIATDASTGFLAEAFESGNQVVVAIRGTDPYDDLNTLFENLEADKSWIDAAPNESLENDVNDAANFLYNIRTLIPYANITITGHSLGGAIAQLIGLASGYQTVAFDAPGASQFYASLSPYLVDATLASDGFFGTSTNYRLEGDQISLVGTTIGSQITVESPYSDTWFNVLNNHGIEALYNQIKLGVPQTSGVPDLPLSLSDFAQEVVLVVASPFIELGLTLYIASVGLINYAFSLSTPPGQSGSQSNVKSEDSWAPNLASILSPQNATIESPQTEYTSFTLTGAAGSPNISSLVLPEYTDVADYEVSFLESGKWSAPELVTPGDTISTPGSDVTGIIVEAEDSSGNAVTLDPAFVFEMGFATQGTFTGTLLDSLACFASGTRILTPQGETPVESLAAGDMVITYDGEDEPIIWIGRRKLDLTRHARPEKAQPIIFEAHCFGESLPPNDLILPQDHALYFEGYLIPAKALTNDLNIRMLQRTSIEYFHIELEQHSIIFAEQFPVETYLETGNRGAFENCGESIILHPDFAQTMREEQSCAPLIEHGPLVQRVRELALSQHYINGSMKSGATSARRSRGRN